MDLSLSPSECLLLRHLALADMPYSDKDMTSASVRNLDEEALREDVPALTWRGMVAVDDGRLSITPLGVAAHYASEAAELSARLVDVHTLADELERLAPARAREAHAIRQLTQGAWSLEEAMHFASEPPA